MTKNEINEIMNAVMDDPMYDPEMMLYAGCEEIARCMGIYWNDDDDIVFIIVDHVPEFYDWLCENGLDEDY